MRFKETSFLIKQHFVQARFYIVTVAAQILLHTQNNIINFPLEYVIRVLDLIWSNFPGLKLSVIQDSLFTETMWGLCSNNLLSI